MNINRQKRWFVGLSISLFVPLLCYFILKSKGHTGRVVLPSYFGIDSVAKRTGDKANLDTFYHNISNKKFINQLGDSIFLNSSLENKILVFHLLDSKSEKSKLTSKNMLDLYQAFSEKKLPDALQLISIEKNNLPYLELRKYADSLHANLDVWWILKSDSNEANQFFEKELFLKSKLTNTVVLVDKYRNIRGYFDGSKHNDMRECANAIAYLLIEKNKYHDKK
ncbi:MAG: hypothetical protein KA275_02750 [Chitinophagaceae bacterium]|nr:hypothetical protein [Chitinophagaceae bacterium]